MAKRRQIITGIAASVAVAGCSSTTSDSSPQENTQNTTTGNQSKDTEAESRQRLRNVEIDVRNISYGFNGLTTQLRLINSKEQQEDRKRVFVRAEAFDGEEVIGEDSLYETFTYIEDVELSMENISELSDLGLSDVTEYRISGRITGNDNELVELRSYSNEELRTTIENTG